MSAPRMFQTKTDNSNAIAAVREYADAITANLNIVANHLNEKFEVKKTPTNINDTFKTFARSIAALTKEHQEIVNAIDDKSIPLDKIKDRMDDVIKKLNTIEIDLNKLRFVDSPYKLNPLDEDVVLITKSVKDSKSKDAKIAEFSQLEYIIPTGILWKKNADKDFNKTCVTGDFDPEEQSYESGLKQFIIDLPRCKMVMNGKEIPESIIAIEDDHQKKEAVVAFLTTHLGADGAKQLIETHSQPLMCYQAFFLDSALKTDNEGAIRVTFTINYDCNHETGGNLRIRSIMNGCKVINRDNPELPTKFNYRDGTKIGTEMQYSDSGKFKVKLVCNDLDIASMLTRTGAGHLMTKVHDEKKSHTPRSARPTSPS